MLTEQQMTYLKNVLNEMKATSKTTEEIDQHEKSMQRASGELSMYDNHPADLGTELFERERDQALVKHASFELEKVDHALQAMQEGRYGFCEVCKQPIDYERLEAIPYTMLCIEHAQMKETLQEELPHEPPADPFKTPYNNRIQDPQNSFEEVAQYGTSDTVPDDPTIDKEDWNDDYTVVEES